MPALPAEAPEAPRAAAAKAQTYGRPCSVAVSTAAARLAGEVKDALAHGTEAEAVAKQRSLTGLVVKRRFNVGSETATEVLRLAKARLSMAGFKATRGANRQIIYRQPDAMAALPPARKAQEAALPPAPKAQEAALPPAWKVQEDTGTAEIGPSALLRRLQWKQESAAPESACQHLVLVKEEQELPQRKAKKEFSSRTWKNVKKELQEPLKLCQVKEELQEPKTLPRWRAGILKVSKALVPGRRSVQLRKSRKSRRRKASWRWSKLLRPLRSLRQLVVGTGSSSSSSTSACASASESRPSFSVEVLSICQVPGWSMRLVMFLGPGMLEAGTLASTCRRLAWSLLRDSAQVTSELRPGAARLAEAKNWRSDDEAKLEQTNGAVGVLAALLPLEPRRSPSAVAAEAAMAAKVSASGDAKARWPCCRLMPLQKPMDNRPRLTSEHLAALPFGARKRRRSSVSSVTSVASQKARRRVLAEATSDLDRARVARLELLLTGLSTKVNAAVRNLAQEA